MSIKLKYKKRKSSSKKGFTLSELMVAVFVFSIAMISVTAIFARFVIVQKRVRTVQQNMEDVRYTMELMAKTLRASTIISCNGATSCPMTTNSVEFYNYSQEKCMRYYFSNNKIKSVSVSVAEESCNSGAVSASGNDLIAGNINNMNFGVTQTDLGSGLGKITISVEICSNNGCAGSDNDKVDMQTSVSLRDYAEANL